MQQTLFANGQHQQSVRQQQQQQQPGLPQDFYYLTKRSLDSSNVQSNKHASYLQHQQQQQQQQSFNWPSSGQIASGLHTLLEHVSKAIENADKQYNANQQQQAQATGQN